MAHDFQMHEEGKNLVVELDIGDLRKDEIKVFVEGDYLRVEGMRDIRKEARGEGFYAREKKSGKFLHQIGLPVNVRGDLTKTEFLDGRLRITIPIQ